MNLDAAQKQQVMEWIEAGLKLAEIQNKLGSDLGLQMTYMEVRFLLDDLKLKLKETEPTAAPPTTAQDGLLEKAQPSDPKSGPAAELAEDESDEKSGVSVSVDRVARPEALVSGGVTFSDGQTAQWYLDQFGRLGLAPKQQGYKPAPDDLMTFQAQLQSELARLGF